MTLAAREVVMVERQDNPRRAQAANAIEKVHLLPAHLLVSREPTAVVTILGSCVAVCLWDARRRIGGINHYLLPFPTHTRHEPLRFAREAIVALVRKMAAAGSAPADLTAKIFGGANMARMAPTRGETLGCKNVRRAEETLAELGIPIVARDVCGERGRKLVFRTDNGLGWVKLL